MNCITENHKSEITTAASTSENQIALPALIPLTPKQQAHVTSLLEKKERDGQEKTNTAAKIQQSNLEFVAKKDQLLRQVSSHKISDCNMLDDLIKEALSANANGELNELISAACDALVGLTNNSHQNWSHAVCHLFEHFHPKCAKYSLLGHEAISPAVNRLIEESSARAIKYGENSFGRTMGGITKYALSLVTPDKIDDPFPWKPACINKEELAGIFSANQVHDIFCRSSTPRQFITDVAQRIAQSSEEVYGWKIPLDLLLAARNEENAGNIDIYIYNSYKLTRCHILPEELPQIISSRNTAMAATETESGLFIDVDDTLISLNWKTEQPQLTDLAETIMLLAPGSRTKITIFTGGKPDEATEKLRQLGFCPELLPVRSKADFRGKRLEFLIDDTNPEMQGFSANEYIDAYSNCEWELLKKDPLGMIARYKATPPPAEEKKEPDSKDISSLSLPKEAMGTKEDMAASNLKATESEKAAQASESEKSQAQPQNVEKKTGFVAQMQRFFAWLFAKED